MNIEARGLSHKLVRDLNLLNSSYIPVKLINRKDVIKCIFKDIYFSANYGFNSHFLLCGPSGAGKYALAMYVRNIFSRRLKNTEKAFLYSTIDCSVHRTNNKIVSEIIRQFDSHSSVLKGKKHIFNPFLILSELVGYREAFYFIVFANVDKVKDPWFIHEISKLLESSGFGTDYDSRTKPIIITFSITTNPNWDRELKEDTLVSIFFTKIFIVPLSEEENYQVLKNRLGAFSGDVLDEEVVGACAQQGALLGSTKIAMDLLRLSSIIAEKHNSERITIDHFNMAVFEIMVELGVKYLQRFSFKTLLIMRSVFGLLQDNEYVITGQVYDEYLDQSKNFNVKPLTRQAFLLHLDTLECESIIDTELVFRGRGGNTRKIMVKKGTEYEVLNRALTRILEYVE
jgi:Cdc6-like AAA superfamily ATPase